MIEPKKNPKKDLNRYSGLFLNIGLVITLLIVIWAFEYKVYNQGSEVNIVANTEEFEDLIALEKEFLN